MTYPAFTVRLPDWLAAWLEKFPAQSAKTYPTVEERMGLVIELARMNIEQRTGGPFAAAVFSINDHRLIAPGVNLVETENCSVLHAEIVAIMLAQKAVGSYNLDGFELVATTEPCAMCLGAVPWSGVRRLVCGAREEDARAIGFDEGPKIQSWVAALEERGLEVRRDIRRDEAAAILKEYQRMGGVIYNGIRKTA